MPLRRQGPEQMLLSAPRSLWAGGDDDLSTIITESSMLAEKHWPKHPWAPGAISASCESRTCTQTSRNYHNLMFWEVEETLSFEG